MFRKIFTAFIIVAACKALKDIDDGSLEDVLKQILKIKPPDAGLDLKEDLHPPKHMIELYHRFTLGRRSSGETIRSITPTTDAHHQLHDTLLFNMSHMGADEEVRLSQLMLRRRRLARHPHPLHRKLLAPPYRVRVYQVVRSGTRARTIPLASIPVPQVSRGGWHSIDVTTAVRELLLSSSDISDQLTLGVRFEAPKSRLLSPAHFLDQKDNTSAFLMVYTDEDILDNELTADKKKPTITRQHIQLIEEHLKNSANNHVKHRHHSHRNRHDDHNKENPRRHKNKNNDATIKQLVAKHRMKEAKRHRELDDSNIYEEDAMDDEEKLIIKSNLIDELLENSETRRVIRSTDRFDIKSHKRRSIYDNEVPHDKLSHTEMEKMLTTTGVPEVVTEFLQPEDDDDGNLIPYPPGTDRKKKRRGRRGKKKNRRHRTTKIPEEWNKRERQHRLYGPANISNTSAGNQTCARRHLVVNFKELGWSNWIIAPKLFNAHYCAGSCTFPVPENVPVSNHAVIQGLVHQRGLYKEVPAPCCVPDTLSPLTILYLEDNDHVILKNYRSMTVETCGCR